MKATDERASLVPARPSLYIHICRPTYIYILFCFPIYPSLSLSFSSCFLYSFSVSIIYILGIVLSCERRTTTLALFLYVHVELPGLLLRATCSKQIRGARQPNQTRTTPPYSLYYTFFAITHSTYTHAHTKSPHSKALRNVWWAFSLPR